MCLERIRYIAIARILRPQGRRGEVSAEIMTDFPARFQKLRRVFVGDGVMGSQNQPTEAALERAWPHKGSIILKLKGIDSISQAQALRGLTIFVPFEERVPLPANTYYWPEIEGCRVLAGRPEARVEIGIVTAVEPTAGVPILHVSRSLRSGDEILIPFAQEICREIDPEAKRIMIDPPEGLLILNEAERT